MGIALAAHRVLVFSSREYDACPLLLLVWRHLVQPFLPRLIHLHSSTMRWTWDRGSPISTLHKMSSCSWYMQRNPDSITSMHLGLERHLYARQSSIMRPASTTWTSIRSVELLSLQGRLREFSPPYWGLLTPVMRWLLSSHITIRMCQISLWRMRYLYMSHCIPRPGHLTLTNSALPLQGKHVRLS